MAAKKNDELNRAAQFLPFDALRGLGEELQSRIDRRNRVERRELSEEDEDKISATLFSLNVGDVAKLLFFDDGCYIEAEGIIDNVDALRKTLTIGEKKIRYENIARIEVK